MASIKATSLANSVKAVTYVGISIAALVGLVIIIIICLEIYKRHLDEKQRTGEMWSVEPAEDDPAALKGKRSPPPRITSGEFFMNYMEYDGDPVPVQTAATQLSSANPKSRTIVVSELATEGGDGWRENLL